MITDFEVLKTETIQQLQRRGFGLWDTTSGLALMLVPGSWYNLIENGTNFVTVDGQPIRFNRFATSNEIRYGYLTYGILVKVNPDAL